MFLKFESNGFAAKACAVLTGVYSFLKLQIKSTLCAIVLIVFDSRPNEPITLFQQQKIVIRKCHSLLNFLTA
jgi:hypothetical protein